MKKFIPISLAYILAYIVAVCGVIFLPFGDLLNTLLADVAATGVIFAFSRAYKNSSFYDAYWSLAPIVIALYWGFSLVSPDVNMLRVYIVTACVIWWGVRLTLNWASHWDSFSHEDWRYAPIREKAGRYEFWADFSGIHLFPTLMVFAGCLPIYAVTQYGSGPQGLLDYIAIIVTVGAILIETFADIQLHTFIKTKKPDEFITSGLWKYSRHPNYFGEFGFWVGLMLFGLAAYPAGWWWIVPGAVAMGLMFMFVSIPLMDERSLASRSGYVDHMKTTSAFVPWVPK